MPITYVKGRKIDQEKLKEFLAQVNIDDFEQEDGTWMSPISGEIFSSKSALYGSFGTYLRAPNPKDPREPTRRGYVRALRAGLEPTAEQKAAHAEYMRVLRAKKKEIDPAAEARFNELKDRKSLAERRADNEKRKAERRAERKLQTDEAYAASLKELLP